MFCGNCGHALVNGASFCPRCGQSLIGKNASANAGEDKIFNAGENKIFISPNETLIASLGNGFVENILYGRVKSCKALLTDQRVYLSGAFFSGIGKALVSKKMERIIDIEDITGTGFLYSASVLKKIIVSIAMPIIIAILYYVLDLHIIFPPDNAPKFLFLEIFSIVYSVEKYLKGRTTYFVIEYAGGKICFDATIIGLANVRDFQHQIRRAKDALKGR